MNVVDLHEPMTIAYKNVQSDYWTATGPNRRAMPRPASVVDPRLCTPRMGPDFYTAWGDPVYLKPLPGGILTHDGRPVAPKTPGASPSGEVGNYITPLPLQPVTPTGPALAAGATVPAGGRMANVVEQAEDIFAEYAPTAREVATEAQRLGQKQIPLWWVFVGLGILAVLRR